jgi:hydrogenase nickel incorporation protein HypA/HybF
MHEAAIIDALIRQVLAEAEAHALARVTEVDLQVGRLQHIDPRTMVELFGWMKEEFPLLAGARLHITPTPIRISCRSCAREAELAEAVFACPHCGRRTLEILSGSELILARLTGKTRDEESRLPATREAIPRNMAQRRIRELKEGE